MNIRPWKFEDILRISEMEQECFPQEPWSYKMLVSSFQTESFFGLVAEDGGEIAGYGGITVAADSADVDNIAVAEQYRRGGVGTAILNDLCTLAASKGAKEIFLEVRVSNSAATSMYLKCGFVGACARTRYYSDGEDCLVMKK